MFGYSLGSSFLVCSIAKRCYISNWALIRAFYSILQISGVVILQAVSKSVREKVHTFSLTPVYEMSIEVWRKTICTNICIKIIFWVFRNISPVSDLQNHLKRNYQRYWLSYWGMSYLLTFLWFTNYPWTIISNQSKFFT